MNLRLAAMLLSAFGLSGCFQDTLDFRNAEISNGKLYEAGANEPFSGKVTNIPYFKLPVSPLMTVYTAVSNITQDSRYRTTFFAGGLMAALGQGGNSGLLCDLGFKKGQPDGEARCTLPQSDTPFITMNFEQGGLEGGVSVNSLSDKSITVAEALYKRNALDGELLIYHPETGKRLAVSNWTEGKPNGLEENYSAKTGRLTFRGTYVNGRLDGEAVKYDDDGQEVAKSVYQNGQLVQNISPAATGNPIDACVVMWTAAFRKKVSEEAVVTMAQLGEWEGWCKEGKHP